MAQFYINEPPGERLPNPFCRNGTNGDAGKNFRARAPDPRDSNSLLREAQRQREAKSRSSTKEGPARLNPSDGKQQALSSKQKTGSGFDMNSTAETNKRRESDRQHTVAATNKPYLELERLQGSETPGDLHIQRGTADQLTVSQLTESSPTPLVRESSNRVHRIVGLATNQNSIPISEKKSDSAVENQRRSSSGSNVPALRQAIHLPDDRVTGSIRSAPNGPAFKDQVTSQDVRVSLSRRGVSAGGSISSSPTNLQGGRNSSMTPDTMGSEEDMGAQEENDTESFTFERPPPPMSSSRCCGYALLVILLVAAIVAAIVVGATCGSGNCTRKHPSHHRHSSFQGFLPPTPVPIALAQPTPGPIWRSAERPSFRAVNRKESAEPTVHCS